MTLTGAQLALLFVSLLTLFGPFANIAPFTALVRHLSPQDQRKLAFLVFLNVMVVLLALVWGGSVILGLLGVTPDSLSVAGGVALLIAGLPMMLKGARKPDVEEEAIARAQEQPQDWSSMVLVPMTFPMSIGGTTAAYVVATTGYASTAVDLVAISAVVLLFSVAVWLTHLFAPAVGRVVGPGGRDILTRVGGIILVAISVQLMSDGLKGLFPILSG